MCKCTRTLEREERHVLSARTLSEREQLISERVCLVLCESKGNPRASREIRARAKEIRARAKEIHARAKEIHARAGRFALAHYINLLSRYKNVLSTFGSKITPYKLVCLSDWWKKEK